MKNYVLSIMAGMMAILIALLSFDFGIGKHASDGKAHGGYSHLQSELALSAFKPMEISNIPLATDTMEILEKIVAPQFTPFHLEVGDACFAGTSWMKASVRGLSENELPPLDPGMVNVTADFAAYRMNVPLSALGRFEVAIPFDGGQLPTGFTAEDVQTFCFDAAVGHWLSIPRDSVSTELQLIMSSVEMASSSDKGGSGDNGALDFINAVIKTPEMPETSAFTPTSIKELEAANPLEGTTLIEPPTANNNGTANMNYPIEIPAGRHGMQPNLALTYNSGGGNGWLGVGWDIPIPSITVETRWGVPRYDTQKESEVYVYEGEQLVTFDVASGKFREMPHRTNQWTDRSDLDNDGHEQFYPRKDEAHDSIVRHGNAPDNYWWSVTHRNGVTDYYGKYAADAVANNNCVLRRTENVKRNDIGAVVYWALAESVDPEGNSVRYYYDIEYHRGVSGGSWGKHIFVDSISYTCMNSSNQALADTGMYSVIFHRRGTDRQDIVTNLNKGVKEVIADVLCHMDVKFRDTLFRQYAFVTKNDMLSNYKTILTDIVRVDSPTVYINCDEVLEDNPLIWSGSDGSNKFKSYAARYHFDYYEYPTADSLFSEPVTVSNLPNDNLCLKGVKNIFHSTALGATKSKSWSLGGTGAAGLGPDICTTIATLGANSAYSNSKSEGVMTLVDIDGDGLADKVFKKDGQLYYRKRLFSDSIPIAFDVTSYPIEHGNFDFLKESSNNVTLGLQASCAANLSTGFPFGWSTTTNYMTDINGDGLIDIVTDEGAFFGKHIQGQAPSFSSVNAIQTSVPGQDAENYGYVSSSIVGTGNCGGIIFDGEIDTSIACIPSYNRYVLPISDTIPADIFNDGQCTARIIGYTGMSQHTRHPFDSIFTWGLKSSPNIGIGPYVPRDSMVVLQFCSKSSCRQDPVSPDFDAVRVWIAPYDDTVTFYSSIRLLPDDISLMHQSRYADGVLCSIEHHSACSVEEGLTLHAACSDSSIVFNIGKKDTATHRKSNTFYAHKDDIFFFRLQSKNDRSFDKAEWKIQVESHSHKGQGLDIYGRDTGIFYSDSDFVLTGRNLFQAPQNGCVWISGNLNYSDIGDSAKIVVKKNDDSVDSLYLLPGNVVNTSIRFDSIMVNYLDTIALEINRVSSGINPQWPRIHFTPLLKFFPSDTTLIKDTVYYYPQIRLDIKHDDMETPFRKICRKYFGELYRGWGQFAYNKKEGQQHCIDISSLQLPIWYTATSANNIDTSLFNVQIDTSDLVNSLNSAVNSVNNPMSSYGNWIEMTAYNEQGLYRGSGLNTAVSASFLDNSEPSLPIPTADSLSGSLSYDGMNIDLENIPLYDHPVPVSIAGEPVQTIRKRHKNSSVDFSMGMDMMIASVGFSSSIGGADIQSDYMDMNGDRYPDPISTNGVQYSMPWGGIGSLCPIIFPSEDHLSATTSSSDGETNGRCYPNSQKLASHNPKYAKMSLTGSGTHSHSEVNSHDNTDYMLFDINGDGLPDMVNTQNKLVCLNVGYGFLNPESWNVTYIRKGTSTNTSDNNGYSGSWGNLITDATPKNSYSFAQCSVSGGTGCANSYNKTTHQMMDVNGDGLPDKVVANNMSISVSYNLGNGQWTPEDQISNVSISESQSVSEDVNIGVTAGFTAFAVLKINLGIQTSPYNRSLATDVAQLVDINGDGYPDYVTSTNETSITIRNNKAGKTNLLRKVTNFTGNTIELDYELSKPCFEKPQRSWNLSCVITNNNVTNCPVGGNRTLSTFSYGIPHYDRYERVELGYDTVRTVSHNTDNFGEPYRQNVIVYNNISLAKRGHKISEAVLDANGAKYIVKNYRAILYDFLGNVVDESTCTVEGTYVGYEAETSTFYEGLSDDSLVIAVSKQYDRYRNIIKYAYLDIVGNGHDQQFNAYISYKQSPGHNLISLPESVRIFNYDSSEVLQSRIAEYDSIGHLIRLVKHNNGQNAVWDFSYDSYGNIEYTKLPANNNGQRLSYQYTYDNTVHTYPILVENLSLGFMSSTQYELIYGKPLKTIDINNNEMWYEYDALGRTIRITAPYEQSNSDPYTLKMKYYPHNYSNLDISLNSTNPYSYAITEHYDCQNPSNPISTTLICDGLGRVIQTKKDVEIGGHETSLVSGKVVLDCFGRTLCQYHPLTESNNIDTVPFYNPNYAPTTATHTSYDILDRQTQVILPMGSYTTTYDYGFGTNGSKKYFQTTITDPQGNQLTTLAGGNGQKIKTIAPMNTITTFKYSPLGQLVLSVDPDNLRTTYQYDLLGRMIKRNHPDAGIDLYEYDPVGNMVRHTNGNGQAIDYSYYFNQLTDIEYPDSTINVHYIYGNTGAVNNRAGRVALVEDASGWQVFSYGALGEVTENIRTFVLPKEAHPYTFTMRYNYDSFNRMQNIFYPDDENVTYHYNRGGMLESIDGNKNNCHYTYVGNISYNKFEQKESVSYGNGSSTIYKYDILQRLSLLTSYTGNAEMMQDINYTYDEVGNILATTNSAGTLSNGLGGKYYNEYDYDQLYRLVGASGDWQGIPYSSYTLNMKYSSNGRITRKILNNAHIIRNHNFVNLLNYDRQYTYYHNTNKLQRINDHFGPIQGFNWDGNGNLIFHSNLHEGCHRKYCWDEDNRLQGFVDCVAVGLYQYDANGERTYKLTGENLQQGVNRNEHSYASFNEATLYASPYVVCTPQGYTKHYYADNERVASRIGNGCLSDIDRCINPTSNVDKTDDYNKLYFPESENNELVIDKMRRSNFYLTNVLECLSAEDNNGGANLLRKLFNFKKCPNTCEKDCYWYHPDHLGSSSWITYSDGKAVQHLHYLPWGEDFVDQRTTNWHARFTFSAKEKDSESGLSYFGSRYYSSDLSLWLSVDPMCDKYPSLSPYVYCADNPVRLVDPNGEDWYETEDGKMHYTLEYTSKKAFEKSGIKGTYQGKTCTKNGQYYSLFGQTLDANSKRGKLTQKIDNAFINHAKYLKAEEYSNGPFDVEIHDVSETPTDFSNIESFHSGFLTTFDNVHDYQNGYYLTSNVRLNVSEKNMTGAIQSFPKKGQGSITLGGPFTGNYALNGFHIMIGNTTKKDVVTLTFSSRENYDRFMDRFHKLFGL